MKSRPDEEREEGVKFEQPWQSQGAFVLHPYLKKAAKIPQRASMALFIFMCSGVIHLCRTFVLAFLFALAPATDDSHLLPPSLQKPIPPSHFLRPLELSLPKSKRRVEFAGWRCWRQPPPPPPDRRGVGSSRPTRR